MISTDFQLNDKITIPGYYTEKRLTVFIIIKINADSIDCIRQNETDSTVVPLGFYNPTLRYYGNKIKFIERAKKSVIAKLRSVIASKQAETVEAVLTDRTPGKRFYQIFSGLPGETHRYFVTIAENETGLIARCVCRGFHRFGYCKHSRAALAKDVLLFAVSQLQAA